MDSELAEPWRRGLLVISRPSLAASSWEWLGGSQAQDILGILSILAAAKSFGYSGASPYPPSKSFDNRPDVRNR